MEPPEGRLLLAEDREPPPEGRLLPTDERELPLDEGPLRTDGLDRLPDDRELPTEPDGGAEYRPLVPPTELRDRELGALRLDEPDGEAMGRL